jgi:hypothetical protein
VADIAGASFSFRVVGRQVKRWVHAFVQYSNDLDQIGLRGTIVNSMDWRSHPVLIDDFRVSKMKATKVTR